MQMMEKEAPHLGGLHRRSKSLRELMRQDIALESQKKQLEREMTDAKNTTAFMFRMQTALKEMEELKERQDEVREKISTKKQRRSNKVVPLGSPTFTQPSRALVEKKEVSFAVEEASRPMGEEAGGGGIGQLVLSKLVKKLVERSASTEVQALMMTAGAGAGAGGGKAPLTNATNMANAGPYGAGAGSSAETDVSQITEGLVAQWMHDTQASPHVKTEDEMLSEIQMMVQVVLRQYAALRTENLSLRASVTASKAALESSEKLPREHIEQIMEQLESLLQEKSRLATENSRLESENTGLQELLHYSSGQRQRKK